MVFFSSAAPAFAVGVVVFEKKLPLSMAEAKASVMGWLESGGYRFRYFDEENGQIHFVAADAETELRILLRSQSALATRVRMERVSAKPLDPALMAGFRRYLAGGKIGGETGGAPVESIPAGVAARMRAVVCIEAAENSSAVFQATGFVMDKRGWIICTAHNLKEKMELSISFPSGRKLNGWVVKIDSRMDLAFIRAEQSVDSAISLAAGRNFLKIGDRVYSIGCPNNLAGTIYTGIVNSPPRKVKSEALWQVEMEIHPGSSGSPVFDTAGRLVGIIKGRYLGTDSVGFIIPYASIINFLDEIR